MDIIEHLCRCCLTRGPHKDLNSTYVFFGKKEVYSEMLKDCFNIVLNTPNSGQICDICIKDLRRCSEFKEQVLKCEKEFLQKIEEEKVKSEIKSTPKKDIKTSPDSTTKKKTEQHRTIRNGVKKTVAKNVVKRENSVLQKNNKKLNDEATNFESSSSETGDDAPATIKVEHRDRDLPKRKKSKQNPNKKRTRNPSIKKALIEEGKVDLIWTTRTTNEKLKHRVNLQTILKYSNVTPFRNKTLVGYLCGYCEAMYKDPLGLRIHTFEEHSEERLHYKLQLDVSEFDVKLDCSDLMCNICESEMDNLAMLKEHLVKDHDQTIYDDVKDYILEFRLTKGDVYNCALCSSKYETFKMLKQHMNSHYRNYVCSVCDTSFVTKRSFNAHTTVHDEGSYKCAYCDKVFSSRPKRSYHEKRQHLGSKRVSNCPYCDEKFESYYQRNQHLVKVHDNERLYKCNVCGKAYILKTLLNYHIKKNHLMERNYQCSECGNTFFSKKALKAHAVTHTGVRNHPCPICQKSYARKYTLREHMRIHNNDRRFKCDYCGIRFVQKCSLRGHLLSNHSVSISASSISTS